jgi:hypothetical protein
MITEIWGMTPEARTFRSKIRPYPSRAATPSWIRAPPESLRPITGSSDVHRHVEDLADLVGDGHAEAAPEHGEVLGEDEHLPTVDLPKPVTTASPGGVVSSMPKPRAWCLTIMSTSWNDPLSSSRSMRSRAVSFPNSCWRSTARRLPEWSASSRSCRSCSIRASVPTTPPRIGCVPRTEPRCHHHIQSYTLKTPTPPRTTPARPSTLNPCWSWHGAQRRGRGRSSSELADRSAGDGGVARVRPGVGDGAISRSFRCWPESPRPGRRLRLKWPNDVLVDDRKVGRHPGRGERRRRGGRVRPEPVVARPAVEGSERPRRGPGPERIASKWLRVGLACCWSSSRSDPRSWPRDEYRRKSARSAGTSPGVRTVRDTPSTSVPTAAWSSSPTKAAPPSTPAKSATSADADA